MNSSHWTRDRCSRFFRRQKKWRCFETAVLWPRNWLRKGGFHSVTRLRYMRPLVWSWRPVRMSANYTATVGIFLMWIITALIKRVSMNGWHMVSWNEKPYSQLRTLRSLKVQSAHTTFSPLSIHSTFIERQATKKYWLILSNIYSISVSRTPFNGVSLFTVLQLYHSLASLAICSLAAIYRHVSTTETSTH